MHACKSSYQQPDRFIRRGWLARVRVVVVMMVMLSMISVGMMVAGYVDIMMDVVMVMVMVVVLVVVLVVVVMLSLIWAYVGSDCICSFDNSSSSRRGS